MNRRLSAETAAGYLTVRPARHTDRRDVLALTAQTWGGHDYIPLFLDEWLTDPDFLLAFLGRELVGCGKATEVAPGEWWLEGLRVHPRYRHRGLGLALSRAVLQHTLRHRPRSVRLSTAGTNRVSLRIISEMGMRLISRPGYYSGRARRRVPEAGPVIVPRLGEALAFYRRSREYRAGRGLVAHTWQFRELNRRYLSELRESDQLCGFRQGSRLAGMMIVRPHRYRPQDLDIGFVGGTPGALAAFRRHLARLAEARDSRRFSAMPCSTRMRRGLECFGLEPVTGFGGVRVFELPVRR